MIHHKSSETYPNENKYNYIIKISSNKFKCLNLSKNEIPKKYFDFIKKFLKELNEIEISILIKFPYLIVLIIILLIFSIFILKMIFSQIFKYLIFVIFIIIICLVIHFFFILNKFKKNIQEIFEKNKNYMKEFFKVEDISKIRGKKKFRRKMKKFKYWNDYRFKCSLLDHVLVEIQNEKDIINQNKNFQNNQNFNQNGNFQNLNQNLQNGNLVNFQNNQNFGQYQQNGNFQQIHQKGDLQNQNFQFNPNLLPNQQNIHINHNVPQIVQNQQIPQNFQNQQIIQKF